MSGRLSRIEETVNSQLDSLHVKIVPRGIPYFIDGLLRGSIRFGKRIGNNNALLNPDNTYQLLKSIDKGQSRFYLKQPNVWINVNSILSLANKEFAIVTDVIDNNIVVLDRYLKFGYTAELDDVFLHASPLIPVNILAGQTTIQVNSNYKLANGDTFLYFNTKGLIQSSTTVKIIKAEESGTSSDPFYIYNYTLYLETAVNRDIDIDEFVYIRAYPAYFSQAIRIPNLYNSTNYMGPFLIDFLSGRIVEGFAPKETFSLKLKDRASQYHVGNQFSYETAYKNYPMLNRPINSKSFLFFTHIKGDTKIKPNKVVFETKDYNFRSSLKLVPQLDFNGQSYRFTTTSVTAGTLIFYFEPGVKIEFTINSGTQSHLITIPPGLFYQMDIVFVGNSIKNKLEMSDWTQVGPQIDYIEYSVVAEATGRGKYQATGILLKPYFLTPEILAGRYDTGDNYNSGFVYF